MKYLYRLYAWVAGYFALPCHLCGREMYGFQHARCGSAMTADGRCMMICPTCTKEGKGIDRDAEARKWIQSRMDQASGPPIDQAQLQGRSEMYRLEQIYNAQLGFRQSPPTTGEKL